MPHRPAVVLRAADIDRAEKPFAQRLNPKSQFFGAWLSRFASLDRVAVSRCRIPPKSESFAYHAHLAEDEWLFVVSGRAVARLDGDDVELGPGDFVAFPAPQAPHLLTNPFDEPLVYLMGGERIDGPDVLEYPELDKRFVLVRAYGRTAFHELGPATFPFGPVDAPAKPPPWRVVGCKGCGSVLVEAALTLAEIPYEREEVDYAAPGPARDRLRTVNPLGQVPTVVLPSGTVMTESAAIVQLIDDLAPGAGLVPRPGDPERAEFLRWLMFLVAAVYPTFTYGDEPMRWVGEAAKDELRRTTHEHRQRLWEQLEAAARGPWFLGPRFSALDVYVAVMTRWRPGRAWFEASCPRLFAIASKLDRNPRLQALWAANFD